MNYCSNCGKASLDFVIPEGDNRPKYICADQWLYGKWRDHRGIMRIWRMDPIKLIMEVLILGGNN